MKKLLGYVGVDSGMLIITDPCYIDSEWEKKDFQDVRFYKHKKQKTLFFLYGNKKEIINIPNKNQKVLETFVNFKQKLSTGKTMNEMVANHEVKEIEMPDKKKLIGTFSYPGICETTMKEKHQIKFKRGHDRVAVAFRSGYGDGLYPVYGTFNKEGRCLKVEINCGLTPVQKDFLQKENITTGAD